MLVLLLVFPLATMGCSLLCSSAVNACAGLRNRRGITTRKIRPPHLGNLDFLKAVCAVCIVFHHYQQHFAVKFQYFNFFDGFFPFGRLVELFFIISGFLTVYTDCEDSTGVYTPLLRKGIRLFPTVWLSLLSAVSLDFVGLLVCGKPFSYPVDDWRYLLANFTLTFSGWVSGFDNGINNPTWYLCVLMLCYWLYYLLKNFCIRRNITNLIWIYGAIPVGILLLNKVFHAYNNGYPFFFESDLRGIPTFFTGTFLCKGYQKLNNKANMATVSAAAFLVCFVLCALAGFNWYLLAFTVFPCLVLFLVSAPQMSQRWIGFAGEISFQIYIWHSVINKLVDLQEEAVNRTVPKGVFPMLIVTAVSIGVAMGVYWFFEIPIGKKLRKYF